jgi:pSer/pThr/pTyr-binding forkhead associated (FHA) protein
MLDLANRSLDLLILLLRLAVVGLLYFFLWQVLRVVARDLRAGPQEAGSASPYGQLVITSSGQSGLPVGKAFPLAATTTIGRSLNSDIALDDNFMSSQHATLELHNDEWLLSDDNSTNGTFVNGFEVRGPTAVNYGDVIRVGRVELRLQR